MVVQRCIVEWCPLSAATLGVDVSLRGRAEERAELPAARTFLPAAMDGCWCCDCLTVIYMCSYVALYPGLPSQLFRSRGKTHPPTHAFFHNYERSCEGRPGYNASSNITVAEMRPHLLNYKVTIAAALNSKVGVVRWVWSG